MTGGALIRRAGDLTRHAYARPAPGRWDRLAATSHRAAAEIEHGKRSEQRRRLVRRLAVASVVVGAGAAVVLAWMDMSPDQ
jgi:hypothetical protein